MKKTILTMALVAISLMGFAQGKITYELNGGVVNEYGWTSKVNMLENFYTDYITLHGIDTATVSADNKIKIAWGANTVSGDIFGSTYRNRSMSKIFMDDLKDKWGWIQDYILFVAANQEFRLLSTLQADAADTCKDSSNSTLYYNVLLRSAVDAFYTNSILNTGQYNESPNFANAGKPAAFFSFTKWGWIGEDTYDGVNPTDLGQPYYEGSSFLGWYENADFSGNPVRTTIGRTGDLKLYARYGEYIPTRQEMLEEKEMNATDAKVHATITYIEGARTWGQDINGDGIVFDFGGTIPEGVVEGKDVSVMGTLAKEGGNYVIKDAVLYGENQIADADVVVPAIVTIDSMYIDKKYVLSAQYVAVNGVRAKSFNDAGLLTVEDISSGKTVLVENATPDPTVIPLNKKVDIIGVVDYSGSTPIMRAYTANITRSMAAAPEGVTYEALNISGGHYELENKWLIASTMGNWASNRPAPTDQWVRALAVKNNRLYFQKNSMAENIQIIVYDAITGEHEYSVSFDDEMFKYQGEKAGQYTANDLKVDGAGHLLSANLITSQKQVFQVYVLDDESIVEGGKVTGKLLIEVADLNDAYPDNATIRIDAIGVYGDVSADAIVMAASASTSDVYYWNISNGVWDGKTNYIATKHSGFGTAPQIYPISTSMFYVDGFTDFPVLFNKRGQILDEFEKTLDNPLIMGANGTVQRNVGPNGVCEFELGGEYFLLIAGDNNEGSSKGNIATSFVLFKCKDESRAFAEMTKMWEFPQTGLGKNSNPTRVQMPFAVVDEAAGTADIYVYGAENGFGRFLFTATPGEVGDAVENVETENTTVKKVFENGQIYIIKNGVRYSVLGAVVK